MDGILSIHLLLNLFLLNLFYKVYYTIANHKNQHKSLKTRDFAFKFFIYAFL